MATVTFDEQQRLMIENEEHIVIKRLPNGEVQLFNVNSQKLWTENEVTLVSLLWHGKLCPVGLPKGRGVYEDFDWNQLSKELKEEAERRWSYVERYLSVTNAQKRSKDIRKKVIGIVASQTVDLSPPSEITLFRWTKFFEASRDIRSLVPLTKQRGGNEFRLHLIVNQIVEQAIDEVYMTPQRESGDAVWDRVKYLILAENEKPGQTEQLSVPDRATIYRHIEKRNKYDVALARYGKRYADRYFKAHKQGARPTYSLERVEIDATPVDVILIDPNTEQIIGRAWLTMVVCCFSRQILGYFVSFEPPSYLTVAECLKHAIAPKDYVKTKYPNIKNAWEAYGIPWLVVCDNGREYHSLALMDSCRRIGSHIVYNPPRTPWWKPKVERLFATENKKVFHRIPGTTFSSIVDRDEYKSKEFAVMTLDRLEEILHHWIIEIYQMEWHRGIQGCPRDKWREGIVDKPPRMPAKQSDLIPMLGAIEYRVIQQKGVELDGLIYDSDELRKCGMLYKKDEKVPVKYRAADLSGIWAWDKGKEDWLPVPAIDQEYTQGLTSWLHSLNKKVAHERYGEVSARNLIIAKNYLWELINKGNEVEVPGKRRGCKGSKIARAEKQGLSNTNPELEFNFTNEHKEECISDFQSVTDDQMQEQIWTTRRINLSERMV